MTLRTTMLGGASRFAHFAGIGRSARTRVEDDKEKPEGRGSRAEDDEDEDKPQGRRSRVEDDQDEDKREGRRSSAEGDEDEDKPEGRRSRAEDDEDEDKPEARRARADEDDDDDKPEGRRSRAEDEDKDADDDDEEMRGNSAAAKARRRERARCAAIFAHPAAAKNAALACSLAFETKMTRREAIAVLKSTPAPAASLGSDRSDRNPRIDAGDGDGRRQAGTGWARAFDKVTGKSAGDQGGMGGALRRAAGR